MDSGPCGVCGRELGSYDYAIPSEPVSHSNSKRMMRYAGLIGLGELIAIAFASFLSNYQSVPLQVGLFETAAGLLFIGVFGFLYAGSAGMIRGQPWNPYYAQEIDRTIREDEPSRPGASLVLLLLGAATLAIAFL